MGYIYIYIYVYVCVCVCQAYIKLRQYKVLIDILAQTVEMFTLNFRDFSLA